MRKYYFCIVEGPHDSAAIGRFLKEFDLSIVQKVNEVDEFWSRMIPRTYPHQNDLLKRVPVPTFYQSSDRSIAIYSAGGEENIPIAFDSLINVSAEQLAGVAVFFDADDEEPKVKFNQMYRKLKDSIDKDLVSIIENVEFNKVKEASIKCGLFIFPNNRDKGTLENILLEGGSIAYPDFIAPAEEYLKSIPSIYKERWNKSKKSKVLFGVMANVLKPGSANQVTIQRDNWISEKTIVGTGQQKISEFLEELLAVNTKEN